MNSARMALDAIREKKGRSFLTMLGIIIGVAAVLILVAVVQGYNSDITAYYEKLGVNKVTVTITQYDRTNTTDLTDTLTEFVQLDLSGAATGITPDLKTSGTIKHGGTSITTSTVYLGSEQFSVCNNYTIDQGRDLLQNDIERRSRVCVIGAYVAQTLFQYADPVGQTIYFNSEPFEVVGVYYAKDGTAEESMDDMIVLPYSMNRALLGSAVITSYTVKVDTSNQMDLVMAELEAFLEETVNSNTGTYTLEDGNAALSESEDETASITLVLVGVAAIALLVGGIGIMNIMLVTVSERTREIGIKKSIGAQRSVIVTQFLVESSVLSAAGGLIGIAIGFAVSLILGKALYGLILLPSAFVTLGSFGFSILIGVGFGLYPAIKASGLQPVDALRSD